MSLTVSAVETAAALAVKEAVVAVAGIVMEAGTFTFGLLLASAIITPDFGAEPDSVTLQESASTPTMDALLQVRALSVGEAVVPLPVRLTACVPALLVRVSWPDADPAVLGLKCTVRTVAWAGLSVIGTLTPESEKPVPLMVLDLIVSGTLPVEVTVTDFVTAVPTATSPNCMEEMLRLRAGAEVVVFEGLS